MSLKIEKVAVKVIKDKTELDGTVCLLMPSESSVVIRKDGTLAKPGKDYRIVASDINKLIEFDALLHERYKKGLLASLNYGSDLTERTEVKKGGESRSFNTRLATIMQEDQAKGLAIFMKYAEGTKEAKQLAREQLEAWFAANHNDQIPPSVDGSQDEDEDDEAED